MTEPRWLPTYLREEASSHHVVQLTFDCLNFCLDHPFGFSIYLLQFLRLSFFWISFCVDRLFRFSIYLFMYFCFCSFFFFFWHKNIEMRCTERLFHAKYHITTLELVGILKSCPSMLTRIKDPPEKAFFTIYGPHKLGKTFLCDQAWPSCTSSRLDCLLRRP